MGYIGGSNIIDITLFRLEKTRRGLLLARVRHVSFSCSQLFYCCRKDGRHACMMHLNISFSFPIAGLYISRLQPKTLIIQYWCLLADEAFFFHQMDKSGIAQEVGVLSGFYCSFSWRCGCLALFGNTQISHSWLKLYFACLYF